MVTFTGPVANCGSDRHRWNDNAAGSAAPGQIAVEQNGPSDATTLRVRTYDAAGVQADTVAGDGFTVVVSCWRGPEATAVGAPPRRPSSRPTYSPARVLDG